MKESPVFVVGMPRSGTTLVSNLINASNKIFIPEETRFFRELSKSSKLNLDFRESYFNSNKIYYKSWQLSSSVILKIKGKSSFKDIFEELIKALLNKQNKNIQWGEKTPIHFMHLNEILKFYPDAKFIHIIRDPRDVFNSLISADWAFAFPYSRRIDQYNYSADLFLRNPYPQNLYSIKFEELLKDPVLITKNIYKFLGLSYSKKVIENFNKSNNLNFSLKYEPWKKNNIKHIDENKIFKWKNTRNSALNIYLSKVFSKKLKRLGYDTQSVSFLNIKFYLLSIKVALIKIVFKK
tara:strand:+ start:1758 stop:2639 length:882 start_codon:yes stop_codon:yes gene_type:complete